MIVFDVSTLVGAAIIPRSTPRQAIEYATMRDLVALSDAIYAELVEVLNRPRLARFINPTLRDELLGLLVPGAVWFQPTEKVSECRDAKDDKYLELAVAADATIIVSSDNDLLVMHPWRGIWILKPSEFVALSASPG